MRKIFKYELPVDGHVITIKEKVIKWLDVKIQNGWPHAWAIVDVDTIEPTEIIAWGTGWEVPQEIMECEYLGTEIDDYGYVWHYFWKKVEIAAIEITKTCDNTINIQNNNVQTYTIATLGSCNDCNDYQIYSSIGTDIANKTTNSEPVTPDLEKGLTASLLGTMEHNTRL